MKAENATAEMTMKAIIPRTTSRAEPRREEEEIIELSNNRIIELSNNRIIELSNNRIIELSNNRIIELRREDMKLTPFTFHAVSPDRLEEAEKFITFLAEVLHTQIVLIHFQE